MPWFVAGHWPPTASRVCVRLSFDRLLLAAFSVMSYPRTGVAGHMFRARIIIFLLMSNFRHVIVFSILAPIWLPHGQSRVAPPQACRMRLDISGDPVIIGNAHSPRLRLQSSFRVGPHLRSCAPTLVCLASEIVVRTPSIVHLFRLCSLRPEFRGRTSLSLKM